MAKRGSDRLLRCKTWWSTAKLSLSDLSEPNDSRLEKVCTKNQVVDKTAFPKNGFYGAFRADSRGTNFTLLKRVISSPVPRLQEFGLTSAALQRFLVKRMLKLTSNLVLSITEMAWILLFVLIQFEGSRTGTRRPVVGHSSASIFIAV